MVLEGKELAEKLIQLAILEDIGDGDHTSLACVPENTRGEARLLVKQDGILAGVAVAEQICKLVSPDLSLEIYLKDGQIIHSGEIVFRVQGPEVKILQAERLILNFMQRMSGIATQTNRLVRMVAHTRVTLLDTRKTTPGFRWFEKEAVKIGGGRNHRFGLYDMVMIKDNHVDYAGGIKPALEKVFSYLSRTNRMLPIEIEVRNFGELEEVLSIGKVQRIMLDNFSITDLTQAVKLIGNRFESEASGGINEGNLVQYAETDVQFISIGALTHQVKSLDLSLKAVI
ncbi:MAG: carboxylating nicotinate-nucleotide diphosphorylase [Bacteroidia bacterium]|nr:carboxylating nicotinate-nucleotide diphosphorylase [Bacteroidia bacterium]